MRLDPHNPARYLFLIGLAHFGMGQLEEAVTLIERALKHNPEAHAWGVPLAAAYAHLGRSREARAALDNYEKSLPPFPRYYHGSSHYRYGEFGHLMFIWPFKDPKVAKRFTSGVLKAGLPRILHGSYKISEKNKLRADEIRELLFGKTATRFTRAGGRYWVDRTKDGKATWRAAPDDPYAQGDSGTSWIENDMLCNQWQIHMFGLKHCMTVFRNPEGTPEMKNEYFAISDFGFHPFSLVD
jgi:tetratricopeptide (TPR) repeat protein